MIEIQGPESLAQTLDFWCFHRKNQVENKIHWSLSKNPIHCYDCLHPRNGIGTFANIWDMNINHKLKLSAHPTDAQVTQTFETKSLRSRSKLRLVTLHYHGNCSAILQLTSKLEI